MHDQATDFDRAQMRRALALARGMLGLVWPNPAVGCLLVKEGAVVAEGVTQPGGRPHAEAMALRAAGAKARGATAYISLEPCSHWGRTAPCSQALVEAGVARAVIATGDPDPRVDGRGLKDLRAAGIAVTMDVCRAEAEALNRGFFTRVRTGRPRVTALTGDLPSAASDAGQDGFLTVRPRPDGLALCCTTARGRQGAWIAGLSRQTLAQGLTRLGDAGLTRVAVAADGPLAERLALYDLIDEIAEAPRGDTIEPLTA